MQVSQLFIYPLKSAKGIAVDQFQLDRRGPQFDRQWMVVNPADKFVTQRLLPRMCLIEPRLSDGKLSLTAPGMPAIEVPAGGGERDVVVWRDTVSACDCGDAVAQWLSTFLGKACRLVEMPKSTQRLVDTQFATDRQTVGFADGFPVLLASQASLDDFNTKLAQPIGFERFRPNIVVAGCGAYAEDSWHEIRVGDIGVSIVKPCSRCIIPSIDQKSGDKQMSVNDALLRYRRREDGKAYFGQNALHQDTGVISVGDSVQLKT